MTTIELLRNLVAYCHRAEDGLKDLANDHASRDSYETSRIQGKRQGVALARGYIEEVLREPETIATADREEVSAALIAGLDTLGERFGDVQVVLTHVPGRDVYEWVCGIEMGHEAPDSDMVGGAAYGLGDTAREALNNALGEAGALR